MGRLAGNADLILDEELDTLQRSGARFDDGVSNT